MSKTTKQLKNETSRYARLEKSLTYEREKQRKTDTRVKISLGGLIIKAQLNHLSKAVILGLLVEAKEQLNENQEQSLYRWQFKGDREFRKP